MIIFNILWKIFSSKWLPGVTGVLSSFCWTSESGMQLSQIEISWLTQPVNDIPTLCPEEHFGCFGCMLKVAVLLNDELSVASVSTEIINKFQRASPIGSHIQPGHNRTSTLFDRWAGMLWVMRFSFFFPAQFLYPSFWQSLIFVSSGHWTVLSVFLFLFLSVFEVYQWFASCGESSAVMVTKSWLLTRRQACLHLGRIHVLLCSCEGVFVHSTNDFGAIHPQSTR